MQTLIYHYGALGDFITTLPVLAAAKRNGAASITLLGKPSIGRLCKDAQLIDACIDADDRAHRHLFVDTAEERAAREFFSPFDTVLIFAPPDSPVVGNALRCSRVPPLHQPPFPEGATLHVTDYHLSLLPAAPNQYYHTVPALHLPESLKLACRKKIGIDHRPYAVIHPGSGSTKKNWPYGRYLAVAEMLRQNGLIVRWLTGPAEPQFVVPAGDLLLDNVTLSECAALLEGCALYIGNDSGITHLAAAVGCPVVAIFGPSDPGVWSPRGHGLIAVVHHPPGDCFPCHLRQASAPRCTNRCMNTISVDEVIAAAMHLIAGRQ